MSPSRGVCSATWKPGITYFKKSLIIEPDQQHAAEMGNLIKTWGYGNQ